MPKEKILVIDDEKDLLKLLEYNLRKEGYEVVLAETGEKGLELAGSEKPDLIVLDLMLPQIDGLEVCRLLKFDRGTRNIPVLMLTAKSSEVDQVVGLELGASDYLTKPFSVKVLLARLKNILKHKGTRREEKTALTLGALCLDRERFSLTIRGKSVGLTKKEFEILAVLMEEAGKAVPREALVETVWGAGSFVSAVSLNMHVKSLRDKLGKHQDAIETVRGIGFRFSENLL